MIGQLHADQCDYHAIFSARLITFTSNLIISQITKTESNNCLITYIIFAIAELKDIVKKLEIPVTCTALKQRNKSLTNGTYEINPNRASVSSVTVQCDMTSKNGVGVTVVGHDSESTFKV